MARITYRSLLLSTVLSVAHVTSGSAGLNQDAEEQRPTEHYCPITQEIMKDPVVASDGRSYERAAIEEWIRTNGISPFTRQELSIELHPNQGLLTLISEWIPEAHVQQSMLAEMSSDEILKSVREEFRNNDGLLSSNHKSKDKDIVLLIGNTGDHEEMPIGGRMFNSETLYPKSFDIETEVGETLIFFELPVLSDTDGSVRNIVNAALVRKILLDARTVRFVYVAGQDQFTADRGQLVQQIVKALGNLFVTASTPSRPLDSGLLVVNKKDGLIEDLRKSSVIKTPGQKNIWMDDERLAGVYHTRYSERYHTPLSEQSKEHVRRIASLDPQKLISVNASILYPSNTQKDIERMYQKAHEEAYQKAEGDRGASLTKMKESRVMWQHDTFWDKFEVLYVYGQNPWTKVLKELTPRSYSSVRNKYIQEQEGRRKQHIEKLGTLITLKTTQLKEETIVRAKDIVNGILAKQAQMGVVPFDFGNHGEYWTQVCGPEVLERITRDAAEQELIREAYIGWIGEYFQGQIDRQIENNSHITEHNKLITEHNRLITENNKLIKELQGRVNELNGKVPEIAGENKENNKLIKELQGRVGGLIRYNELRDIVRGHEAVYEQFLRGKLVYKPNKDNDEGRKEFRISDLANPLSGTFDIRGCGDSDRHLSISTGFRTGKNPANENKLEVWIVPQFVLQKDARAKRFNDFLQELTEHRGKPFAIIFTWGGWAASNFDHAVTGVVGNEFATMSRAAAVAMFDGMVAERPVVRAARTGCLANFFTTMSE